MDMELRMQPIDMEVNEDGSMTVGGYVNETEKWSEPLGYRQKFFEKIARGAWQRAIDSAGEVHFLAEHKNAKILSSTRNGSLVLKEDERGLYMSATISPTSWGRDYYQLIKDGILRNMSFGFRKAKDVWKRNAGRLERTITELELMEVSVVRDPAYSQSSISARGIDLVEDIDIPDDVKEEEERSTEVEDKPLFEIRSEGDMQKFAQMLAEAIKQSTAQEVEVEENDEPEEVVQEDQKVEDKPDEQEPQDNVEETKKDEEPEEKEDENKEEDKVEDDEEKEEEPVNSDSDKLKDFINKYKQEDK